MPPAKLMYNFNMRTQLSLLSNSTFQKPKADNSTKRQVRFRMKEVNASRSSLVTKSTDIRAGDSVRVRLPVRSHKMAPNYAEPLRVRKANGTTVWSDNGQRWCRRRCIKHQPAVKQQIPAQPLVQPHPSPTDVEADDDEGPIITFQPSPMLRRSTRQRQQRDFSPFIRF